MLIPYDMFKAACACMGSHRNRPETFQTILVTSDGRLVSTDGHVMYVSNPLPGLRPGPFKVHGTPEPCVLVDLDVHKNIARGLDENMGKLWRLVVAPNAGVFPDWKAAIWEKNPESLNPKIGWALPVLKKLCIVFESENWFTYESGGPLAPAKVTGRHGTVWIAPCKLP